MKNLILTAICLWSLSINAADTDTRCCRVAYSDQAPTIDLCNNFNLRDLWEIRENGEPCCMPCCSIKCGSLSCGCCVEKGQEISYCFCNRGPQGSANCCEVEGLCNGSAAVEKKAAIPEEQMMLHEE